VHRITFVLEESEETPGGERAEPDLANLHRPGDGEGVAGSGARRREQRGER